jgi:hypothetical protein
MSFCPSTPLYEGTFLCLSYCSTSLGYSIITVPFTLPYNGPNNCLVHRVSVRASTFFSLFFFFSYLLFLLFTHTFSFYTPLSSIHISFFYTIFFFHFIFFHFSLNSIQSPISSKIQQTTLAQPSV